MLAAKADSAAGTCTEATAGMGLSAFVVVLLGRRRLQGSRIRQLRRRELCPGRPGPAPSHPRAARRTFLAWGWWEPASGMTAHLTHTDHTRITRFGMTPITATHGMALLDEALTHPLPTLIPCPLNTSALTAALSTAGNDVPALLRDLVHTPRRPAATPTHHNPTSLANLLGALPEEQQHPYLLPT